MENTIMCLLVLTLLLTKSCSNETKQINTQESEQIAKTIPVETMDLPAITYDFPKNKSNPFDINSDDRYFIYASGFTNLTDSLADFKLETLEEKIPLGRKTLAIHQKICFFKEGALIKKWGFNEIHDTEDKINGHFVLFTNKRRTTFLTDWKRNIESYSVLKNTADASIYSYLWESFEEAEEFAKEVSAKENVTVMVAIIVDTFTWH